MLPGVAQRRTVAAGARPIEENIIARYKLICCDCGGEAEAFRSDAKVCSRCRVLRDLTYCLTKYKRPKTCRLPGCETKYRPAHARDLGKCGPHAMEAQGHRHVRGLCSVCHEPDVPLYRAGVKACLSCIKDPDGQVEVFRRLNHWQAITAKSNREALARLDAGEPALTRLD